MSNEGREIIITALKYDPQVKASKPHFVEYKLKETPGMTLFVALNYIREHLDSDLSFDFVCRAGICGSCGMMINGKPRLACKTLTSEFKDGKIQLLPMPAFKLLKDLSVNTGEWMHGMCERVESWIHSSKKVDIAKLEERVEPESAQATFELDRCIECGICIAACGTKIMRPDFIGAVGLNRVARFEVDAHDERTMEDYYELVGDDNGVFGCMTLLGCQDNCPKNLPLQTKIAYMRRKLVELR